MQYPPCATNLPFICELCTTRAHIRREVDPHCPTDITLLMLERMRMIDVAHAWSTSTLRASCYTITNINKFFTSHNLPTLHDQLRLPSLRHPPLDISIPLFWSMEHYTTFPSNKSKGIAPSWNSGRAQRSAVSLYSSWVAAVCFPSKTYKDASNRLLSAPTVSPSDNILARMTAGGMSARLGTETKPSQALTAAHIQWNQRERTNYLSKTRALPVIYCLVAAQCAELIAWLGWLRASELFHLRTQDVEMVPPEEGAKYGLPPNVGAILLRLLPSTKSSRTKSVDVIIAWRTASGLSPGHWLTLLFKVHRLLQWNSPNCFLFRHPNNTPWSSQFFRSNHLHPLLHLQQLQGDITLRHINPNSQDNISKLFYGMHSYRRGGQSHCTKKRQGCKRAALPHEQVEHGRWRTRNTGKEDVATHYTELSVEDRVYLTLLCF